MASDDSAPDGAPRAGRSRRVHGDGTAAWTRLRATAIPDAASVAEAAAADLLPATGAELRPTAGGGELLPGVGGELLPGGAGSPAGVDPTGYDPTGFDAPMHEAVTPGLNRIPSTQPTQIIQPDWITEAQRRAQAEGPWTPSNDPPAWVPGALDEPSDEEQIGSASLVRPYARTGGRTKPVRHLDLEALVATTVNGKEAAASPLLSPEHSSVIMLCTGTVSVAEIAARLSVPLGVARVIIADMVDLGLVEVMKTSAVLGDERDPEFLRRVLSGLQRL